MAIRMIVPLFFAAFCYGKNPESSLRFFDVDPTKQDKIHVSDLKKNRENTVRFSEMSEAEKREFFTYMIPRCVKTDGVILQVTTPRKSGRTFTEKSATKIGPIEARYIYAERVVNIRHMHEDLYYGERSSGKASKTKGETIAGWPVTLRLSESQKTKSEYHNVYLKMNIYGKQFPIGDQHFAVNWMYTVHTSDSVTEQDIRKALNEGNSFITFQTKPKRITTVIK